ncbi:MAG TPA: YfhO family protein [Vicinamibacterales bacterium]
MPVDLLYRVTPWAVDRPADLAEYTNLVLTDPVQQFYPWMRFAVTSVHAGDSLQWNPFTFLGTPFLANPQTALYSPFTLPFWILPLPYAFGVSAALKLWVGAMGMHLLVSRFGCGRCASLFAGCMYAFSPFQIVWLSHPVTSVFAWLPLAVLLTERVLAAPSRASAGALSLVVGAVLLSAHPGSQLHVVTALVVYAIGRCLVTVHTAWRVLIARVGVVAAAIAGGILIGAVVWLPFSYVLPGSHGVDMRAGGGGILPLSSLITMVLPDWWGNPTGTLSGGPANYIERLLYIGIMPMLLLISGAMFTREWRKWAPFALVAAIGLMIPLGVEPLRALSAALPGLSNANNARMIGLFHFGSTVVAAFALSQAHASHKRLGRLLMLALLLCGIYLLGRATAPVQEFRPVLAAALQPAASMTTTDILRAGTLLRACVAIVFFGAMWTLRARISRNAWMTVMTAVSVVELMTFSRGFQPMTPPQHVWPALPPSIARLQQLAGSSRTAGLLYTFPPEAGTAYGIRDIRGYSAPQPDGRLARIMHLATPSLDNSDMLLFAALSDRVVRVFDLFAVRFVIADREGTAASYSLVYEGRDARIFQNPRARERTFVPRRIISTRTESATLATLFASDFNPLSDVVVETDTGAEPSGGDGTVRIVRESHDTVALEAEMRSRGLVVLADAWAPGWTVAVDDAMAPVVRVDSVLRGVEVSPGRHRITWQYVAPGLYAGAAISIAAALTALLLVTSDRALRARAEPAAR